MIAGQASASAEQGPAEPALRRSAVALAAALLCLTWTPLLDRLDLQKLLIGLLLALGLILIYRKRALEARPAFWALMALTLGGLVDLEGLGARVEGWAPLVMALCWFTAAAVAPRRATVAGLGGLAGGLGVLGLLQAAGLPLLNTVEHFQGRVVMGAEGNPSQFGALLALLLPFTLPWGASRPRARHLALFTLTFSALILTGSRAAWVMALFGVARLVQLTAWRGLLLTALSTLLLAGALDRGAALPDRAREASRGLEGRLYLWRVHLSALSEITPFGYGPEATQRRWPARQRAHLAAHPEQAHLYSDLRHAHADVMELLDAFGLLGLVGLSALLWRLRGPPLEPARLSLAAALVGGLAAPILWLPTTLVIAAIAAGLMWRPAPRREGAGLLLGALIAATLIVLAPRVHSEALRATGGRVRAEARGFQRAGESLSVKLRLMRAGMWFEDAQRVDPRNPRASIERGRVERALGNRGRARAHFRRAARDLPTDGVLRAAGEAGVP